MMLRSPTDFWWTILFSVMFYLLMVKCANLLKKNWKRLKLCIGLVHKILNVRFSWSKLALSPKLICPVPSLPKHTEKESAIKPSRDSILGTDIFSWPSPNKPFGSATSRKEPVWTCPQLHNWNWHISENEFKNLGRSRRTPQLTLTKCTFHTTHLAVKNTLKIDVN